MRSVVVLVLLMAAACATPYQPHGMSGGYTTQRIGRDRFLIQVAVNSFTPASTAYAYFVRRADEVCRAAGYDDWIVEDRSAGTEYLALEGEAHAKPHTEGIVRCRRAAGG